MDPNNNQNSRISLCLEIIPQLCTLSLLFRYTREYLYEYIFYGLSGRRLRFLCSN